MRNQVYTLGALCLLLSGISVLQARDVRLTEVPDYAWHAGCFGTAGGNLIAYWDRHGFPNFYTGPTAGGVAPLNNFGQNAGIRSLWASRAGVDGRPINQPGHIDDYWLFYNDEIDLSYESTSPDPYVLEGREEHAPDCIGDFMGASQNKWKNLNGECDGNIDAYAVTFWDSTGEKRVNFAPDQNGVPVPDVPSGLRAWSKYKGYEAEVISQLVDFNPTVSPGKGFTFEDLKTEIDAGYPVMLILQNYNETSRDLLGMPNANPETHAMLAYGYLDDGAGNQVVRYKTSWGGSGDNRGRYWQPIIWEARLPVRGVICFRPLPKITSITSDEPNAVTIKWDGPASILEDLETGEAVQVHQYLVEKSNSVNSGQFEPVGNPTKERELTVATSPNETAFFRVRLIKSE